MYMLINISDKEKLIENGLKSFGVQGMIINHKLFPIEINRQERFAEKSFFENKSNER